jgi:hypothetical protein
VAHETKLVFVYNANSGLFNTLSDVAHKIFSPATYACNLCALTHTPFGMRREWQDFITSLNTPVEFLHADEFKAKYQAAGVALPAVFQKEDGQLKVWLDSNAINSCQTLAELKQLLASRALQTEA